MGEVVSLAHHEWLILPIQNKQHLPSVLCLERDEDPLIGGAATHSKVYDSHPEQGHNPPLHHILMVVAVICRVGLPAILEVIGQHVVPAVL